MKFETFEKLNKKFLKISTQLLIAGFAYGGIYLLFFSSHVTERSIDKFSDFLTLALGLGTITVTFGTKNNHALARIGALFLLSGLLFVASYGGVAFSFFKTDTLYLALRYFMLGINLLSLFVFCFAFAMLLFEAFKMAWGKPKKSNS